MKQSRRVDLTRPVTWEYSGFSQNGEDGILEVLRGQLLQANRYFIEIGAGDGIENNSGWLVVVENYNGLMIDGDPRLVECARRVILGHSIGVECETLFVTTESVARIKEMALHLDPDVFSLDIDGNDYYIARKIINSGFRPKIFIVEYNSVFGPERSVTIEYKKDFFFKTAHPTHLYYGVSISGWRKFFKHHGYKFVTVDRNGVNAFFVDPEYFDETFLQQIQGLDFAENRYQYKKFKNPFDEQFALIEDQKLFEIEN